jgi:hypothetical protein
LFLGSAFAFPSQAIPILYSAFDDGAGSLGAAPNSMAMAAAFDLASGPSSLIDFESGLPVGVSVSPGLVTSLSGCGFPCGFNTTVGGSFFYLAEGFSHTFSFTDPIDSFGAYLMGVQYNSHTLTYTDGTTQILSLPPGDLSVSSATFFGFIDAGASITSITIDVGFDIVSIDDVRFVTAVPEPTTFSFLGLGLVALGLIGRRHAPQP